MDTVVPAPSIAVHVSSSCDRFTLLKNLTHENYQLSPEAISGHRYKNTLCSETCGVMLEVCW